MIRYKDSGIIRILPESLRHKDEVKAISYAINRAIQKLIAYSERICVYAAIDELPERILDVLAVELRTQYYEPDMTLETKRNIVKKTLLWYHHAGTPSAVREMIEAVFGIGEVEEWFEYGGKPYYFKIITDTALTEDIMERFAKIIGKVKNTRSHLEAIELIRSHWGDMYVACAAVTQGKSVITENGLDQNAELHREHWENAYTSGALITMSGRSVIKEEGL